MFEISSNVVQLYRDEMDLKDGDFIQLFVRYAGGTSGGYAIGVNKNSPESEDFTKNIEGINFFVKPDDHWFVEGMILDYDKMNDNFICKAPSVMNLLKGTAS